MTAVVTKMSMLAMQVCVPTDWTDDQVNEFAEAEYPCGTAQGWQIRREGDEALQGAPERAKCSACDGHVHIMLDA